MKTHQLWLIVAAVLSAPCILIGYNEAKLHNMRTVAAKEAKRKADFKAVSPRFADLARTVDSYQKPEDADLLKFLLESQVKEMQAFIRDYPTDDTSRHTYPPVIEVVQAAIDDPTPESLRAVRAEAWRQMDRYGISREQ